MNSTAWSEKGGGASIKSVTLPLTALSVSASWDTNAIGDAARAAGLKTLSYADVHSQSYVFGIWQKEEVIVYGE